MIKVYLGIVLVAFCAFLFLVYMYVVKLFWKSKIGLKIIDLLRSYLPRSWQYSWFLVFYDEDEDVVLQRMLLWIFGACFGLVIVQFEASRVLGAVMLISSVFSLLRVRTNVHQRLRQVRINLPHFLDVLAMLIKSGHPISVAIQFLATQQSHRTVLLRQCEQLVATKALGSPLMEALDDLCLRVPIREVEIMVRSLQQSLKQGSQIVEILQQQAQVRRDEILLAAEKRAQEAPVKLLGPLLLCFFPVSFLLLLGPIAITMIRQY